MAIFNPNRKQGGTIELVRDAQGNYTTQEVGFNTLASLSIPDFKTTTTPTTTTTDTKTATDVTGNTIDTQTQMAFQMPDRDCLLYTSPSPRDKRQSRMPSSA